MLGDSTGESARDDGGEAPRARLSIKVSRVRSAVTLPVLPTLAVGAGAGAGEGGGEAPRTLPLTLEPAELPLTTPFQTRLPDAGAPSPL